MPLPHHRLMPQPLIGVLTMLVVLALLLPSATLAGVGSGRAAATVFLSLFLGAGMALAHHFPIHLRRNCKLYVGSAALYLMATLLPPAVAMAAAGLGMLCGELMVRSRRGLYLSDIATQVGRLMVVVLAASAVAHSLLVWPAPWSAVPLLATALVLWLGDVATLPLVLSPISGEQPRQVVDRALREAGLPEGAQYLIGILGTLVAHQEMWALALLLLPVVLVYLAFKSAEKVRVGTRQMLAAMADTVDMRDPYTGGHSRRVAAMVEGILRELGESGPETQWVIWAARVHDIGKIGIPDEVLKKEGPLTAEERTLMQTHPDQGASLLQRYPDLAPGVEIVRHHHERWDGDGYPLGLRGADIPFGARVIAVADSFDAMTSDRPYRRALSADTAAAVLREGCGKQWDPVLVDAFLRSIRDRLREPAVPILWLVKDARAEPGLDHRAESM